jgi:hypothetical protein
MPTVSPDSPLIARWVAIGAESPLEVMCLGVELTIAEE